MFENPPFSLHLYIHIKLSTHRISKPNLRAIIHAFRSQSPRTAEQKKAAPHIVAFSSPRVRRTLNARKTRRNPRTRVVFLVPKKVLSALINATRGRTFYFSFLFVRVQVRKKARKKSREFNATL